MPGSHRVEHTRPKIRADENHTLIAIGQSAYCFKGCLSHVEGSSDKLLADHRELLV